MVSGQSDAGQMRAGHLVYQGHGAVIRPTPANDPVKGAVVMIPEAKFRHQRLRGTYFSILLAILAVISIIYYVAIDHPGDPAQGAFYSMLPALMLVVSLWVLWVWARSDLPPMLFSKGIELGVSGASRPLTRRVFIPFSAMVDLEPRTYRGEHYLDFRSKADGTKYVLAERVWGLNVLRAVEDAVLNGRDLDTPI